MPNPTNPFDRLIGNLNQGLGEFLDDLQDSAEDFLADLNRQALQGMRRQVQNTQNAVDQQAQRRAQRPSRRHRGPVTPPTGGKAPTPPQAPQSPNAYDYLEVSTKASQETISAAFRSLGQRFHPDNKQTGDAEKFKAITAAYTVLKDPKRRKAYDRKVGLA